jgi:hypothetical protein
VSCPSTEQLLAFSQGRLASGSLEEIGRHVAGCRPCEERLGGLDDSSDALLGNLSRFLRSGPAPPDPALARIEARARAIPLGRPASLQATVVERRPPPEGEGDALEGAVLGSYRLQRALGKGGMGRVYQAVHVRLQKVVAVKVLPPTHDSDTDVARFLREMEALGALAHPNIVSATDAGEAGGRHFLVMEYVDGLDLGAVVRRHGPLTAADAAEAIRQAAAGLQYVHEHGRVHRDLKPSNLMLAADGTVKVLDLGLALLHRDRPAGDELTVSGQVMGTADYMAPEQWLDSHAVDIRADIYGLGCTLYKLLAGAAPFAGPDWATAQRKRTAHLEAAVPPLRDRPDVPEAFRAVLARMLAKDPDQRFPTPAAVAEALAPFTAGADLRRLLASASGRGGDPPPGAAARTPAVAPAAAGRRDMRGRRWVPAAVALALVAGAALAVAAWSWRPPEPPPAPSQPAARPSDWHDLPDGAPLALDWPRDPKNSHWEWDPAQAELRVMCNGISLIRLGESATGDYTFEVSFYQQRWGGAGIFFGYQPDVLDGKPGTKYQIIELDRLPHKGGADTFYLSWGQKRRWPDGGGRNSEAATLPVADVGEDDVRLRITVAGGVLRSVHWNGVEVLKHLRAPPAAPAGSYPTGADCQGAFGAFSSRGSVFFRRPRSHS